MPLRSPARPPPQTHLPQGPRVLRAWLLGVAPAVAVALVLSLPGASAAAPAMAEVRLGDADLNGPLASFQGAVGYIDANTNGLPDDANPDEPVYLDLDASRSVTYADVRLAAYGDRLAGTAVGLDEPDVGRSLSNIGNAWFGKTPSGLWVLDVDVSADLSVGDIAFPDGQPAKVHAGAASLHQGLSRHETSQPGMFARLADQPRGFGTTVYADMDALGNGGGRVTAGDVRIVPAPQSTGNPSLPGTSAGIGGTAGLASASGLNGSGAAGQANAQAILPAAPAWRPLDWMLVALGVANLAGLFVVGNLLRQTQPKNPFR